MLGNNAALKYVEPLIVKAEVTANVVKITDEKGEFLIELRDLGLYSFPDWPSLLKASVDSFFERG